ncbi:MAG: HAD-IA family hydrolase [Muribaculaceae bacterium]|nr:HAD-IA family hydrolase [Muribaculaceae bacterium]
MTDTRQAILRYTLRHGINRITPLAALIDMDGTLYDSMLGHCEAWYQMMTENGINVTSEEFYLYEGRTGASTIDLIVKRELGRDATDEEKTSMYERKAQLFRLMPPVNVMPGAQSMVSILMSRGITPVLVTGSGQVSLINRLSNDFPNAFAPERRITSRDVIHGKPHPEPYLKAMSLVGVQPTQSLAIDNAPLGIRSAADSGAFTIGVTTGPISPQTLRNAGADIVFDSMPSLAQALPDLLDQLSTQ